MRTTTTDEAPARFDREAEESSFLRRMIDRYNAPLAWGVGASYIFYLSAVLIMPSLGAGKMLEWGAIAVGLVAVMISAVVHRRT